MENGHRVRAYNEDHGTKTAFFYFFESVDDEEVAVRLFQATFKWARSRGLESMIGPMGLLAGDGHGALVDGTGSVREWVPPGTHPITADCWRGRASGNWRMRFPPESRLTSTGTGRW
ncbi:hypothetical protein KGY64_07240 [Candidatus Bipolaricaulota bacterium]|nr:hypothetical protein [Candidatus Bipolaricaulota bacterium]